MLLTSWLSGECSEHVLDMAKCPQIMLTVCPYSPTNSISPVPITLFLRIMEISDSLECFVLTTFVKQFIANGVRTFGDALAPMLSLFDTNIHVTSWFNFRFLRISASFSLGTSQVIIHSPPVKTMANYHNFKSQIILEESPLMNNPIIVKVSALPKGEGTDKKGQQV